MHATLDSQVTFFYQILPPEGDLATKLYTYDKENNNDNNNKIIFRFKILLIDYLNDKNIVYGIVTNKPLEYAKPIIEFFDELRDCKILICPDHLRKTKPDPEGINLACDKLDINQNFACYVGDHDVDIAAGLAANVPVFACEYGYGSFEKGSQSNEIRIMHPSEIIQFIEKINE